MENRTSTPIQLHQPAVINWPTRSVGAAKHVRWQRWLAQTLRFVSPPSGQHARGFQMGFEPQLAGRLVYNVSNI